MNGLAILKSEDFSIQRGQKDKILCNGIPGFSLILFYSTKCEHCQSLVPIFKKLPGTVPGCQFGVINISNNKKCVLMSRETIIPIEVVPFIILFYNGKPFMRYKGPYDRNELASFVVDVSKSVQRKQQFSSEKVKKDVRGGGIPEYTIGHPLCGPDDKVCYLLWEDAYDGDSGGNQQDQQQPHNYIPREAGMG